MAWNRKVVEEHDHENCITQALDSADQLCSDSGSRLTELRRRVLQEVWRSHDAVKAYDILDRLSDQERTAKPPTVYRALQFLQEQGLVHRLESLNAFVGCSEPQGDHSGQFLICDRCGWVREIHAGAVDRAIRDAAERAGFAAQRQMVEVLGTCNRCR